MSGEQRSVVPTARSDIARLVIRPVRHTRLDLVNLRRERSELDFIALLNILRVGLLPQFGCVQILRRVDEEVERARLVEQRQERDTTRDLTNDSTDLLSDLLLGLLDSGTDARRRAGGE
jgi:hypothetical protein